MFLSAEARLSKRWTFHIPSAKIASKIRNSMLLKVEYLVF